MQLLQLLLLSPFTYYLHYSHKHQDQLLSGVFQFILKNLLLAGGAAADLELAEHQLTGGEPLLCSSYFICEYIFMYLHIQYIKLSHTDHVYFFPLPVLPQ